jgi:hypothetical protein
MSLAWMRKRTSVRGLVLVVCSLLMQARFVVADEPTVILTAANEERTAEADAAEPADAPSSGDPLWIWSPAQSSSNVPQGSV